MSEQYRLVYSAELNEGQHAAVVKKRLAAILKLDDARMDVLFSGKSVVLKKATDEKTAARYQEVFNKAGARLRILPVEGAGLAVSDAPAASAAARAFGLSPIASIASGVGPINMRPVSSQARPNSGFSARKPYPGCTASAPVSEAARRTASIFSGYCKEGKQMVRSAHKDHKQWKSKP